MSLLDYKTYHEARENFRWNEVWELFEGTREKFNIAHECIDRHRGKGTAIRVKFDDGRIEEYSFDDISLQSSRFANALKTIGVKAGDRVAIMLDPSREFYVSFFGTLKRGAVAVPFYPLFGPEAVAYRVRDSRPGLVVTSEAKARLFDTFSAPHIITTGSRFDSFIAKEPVEYQGGEETRGNDVALLQYTSGTTRRFPEGIRQFHKFLPVLIPSAVFGLGLRRGDRFFCPSSPAWGHGLWQGTLVPLALGISVGAYSGRFSEKMFLDAIQQFEVNNLSAAPTAFRRLKNSGLLNHAHPRLERISYSMEAMDTDTFNFLKSSFGVSPCSLYGSTEVGVIILHYNGYPDYDIKAGSIGKAMLGLDVAVLDEQGNKLPPGRIGDIAVRRKCLWVRVKDAGVCDEDGYFWHKGRVDDVIKSGGWTISPSEIEEVLQRHAAVEEAVVAGATDEERGQIVKAYLKVNTKPNQALKKEIQEFVKKKLSKHEYPRVIEFVEEIPKTPAGKIDRKKIKEWASP